VRSNRDQNRGSLVGRSKGKKRQKRKQGENGKSRK